MDIDVDVDIDMVGSVWGSSPAPAVDGGTTAVTVGQQHAPGRALLLNPPAPLPHLDLDVDVDVDIDIDADMDLVGSAWGSPPAPAVDGGTTARSVGQQHAPGSFSRCGEVWVGCGCPPPRPPGRRAPSDPLYVRGR